RGWIVDHNIPLAILQRVELPVAVADQLLDFVRQFPRVRFASIKRGDIVASTQCIADLIRTSESCAAENENSHWPNRSRAQQRARAKCHGSASSERKLDEVSTSRTHYCELSCQLWQSRGIFAYGLETPERCPMTRREAARLIGAGAAGLA